MPDNTTLHKSDWIRLGLELVRVVIAFFAGMGGGNFFQ